MTILKPPPGKFLSVDGIFEIPKPPKGDFLSGDDIAALAKDHHPSDLFEDIEPPNGINLCAYCRKKTKQKAYREKQTNITWPACCADCIDKWEPINAI